MSDIYLFLSGAAMLGAWIGGVYFFKFWSKTKDQLFLLFSISFWLMALERMVLLFEGAHGPEDHSLVYLIRLAANMLIIYAIVAKNTNKTS